LYEFFIVSRPLADGFVDCRCRSAELTRVQRELKKIPQSLQITSSAGQHGGILAELQDSAEGEIHMMIDWNEYHKQIGATLGELMKLSPDTVRGYQTLSAANSKTGKLDEKTRQLISLAVAVTTHCDGCIVVHSEAALKAGATKEEIAEALGVAVAMNAGAALIYSTRVLDAVNAKGSQVKTA
jgi:AhpD family alkylhydroperoxidase